MRLKRCAAQPAAIASNTDFSKMAGSTAGSGIPNNNELAIGGKNCSQQSHFPAEFICAD